MVSILCLMNFSMALVVGFCFFDFDIGSQSLQIGNHRNNLLMHWYKGFTFGSGGLLAFFIAFLEVRVTIQVFLYSQRLFFNGGLCVGNFFLTVRNTQLYHNFHFFWISE